MESLEDDGSEVFKGGTLEISQETWKSSRDNSVEQLHPTTASNDKKNTDSRTGIWSGMNPLIAIPKRISGSLWNCQADNGATEARPACDAITQAPLAAVTAESPSDYFTFRDGVVDGAVRDCVQHLIVPETDGEVLGSFLITEISFWDAEKERLIIVTTGCVIIVKYDFIALKQLDHKKIPLTSIDSLIIGELVYPPASFVPRLNGLASGVSNVMRGCLIERWSKQPSHHQHILKLDLFQARNRNSRGVRLMWNRGAPVPFKQKWNPFTSDVPFSTFSSHPLYTHTESIDDARRGSYGVEEFSRCLIQAVEKKSPPSSDDTGPPKSCVIHHKDIVLQSYVGLGSLIHNRNALGFFKVRGRFSF